MPRSPSDDNVRRRELRRIGHDVIVHNWYDTGDRDQYGDPVNQNHDRIETKGIVQVLEQVEPIQLEQGPEFYPQVTCYLPDDVTVRPAEDEEAVEASVIEEVDSNKEWRVQRTWHQNNGIIRCMCTDN